MIYPEALCGDITAHVPAADGKGWACGSKERGMLGACFACDLAPYIPSAKEARIKATAYPLLEVPDDANPQKSEDDHPSSAREY